MSAVLNVSCAGAVQSLVTALQARFLAETGCTLVTRFGAVGALREALLEGAACDVMIVTDAMVTALGAAGHLRPESRTVLGQVQTGLAVRADEAPPQVGTGAQLAVAVRAADAIYYPDPLRATAGVHFADVLRRLGVHDEVLPRCHTFANGATAMRALAASQAPGQLGCTQVSEILFTPGLRLVGALPPGFGLATAYSAAIAQGSGQLESAAAALLDLLSSAQTQDLRRQLGFEPAPSA